MEYQIVRSIYSSHYAKLLNRDESSFNIYVRKDGNFYKMSRNIKFEDSYKVDEEYLNSYFVPVSSSVTNNIFKLCPSTLGDR